MAYSITVKEIIKQFKLPIPTTGKIDLTIVVDYDVKIDAPYTEIESPSKETKKEILKKIKSIESGEAELIGEDEFLEDSPLGI